jgi:hypothetical protein
LGDGVNFVDPGLVYVINAGVVGGACTVEASCAMVPYVMARPEVVPPLLDAGVGLVVPGPPPLSWGGAGGYVATKGKDLLDDYWKNVVKNP